MRSANNVYQEVPGRQEKECSLGDTFKGKRVWERAVPENVFPECQKPFLRGSCSLLGLANSPPLLRLMLQASDWGRCQAPRPITAASREIRVSWRYIPPKLIVHDPTQDLTRGAITASGDDDQGCIGSKNTFGAACQPTCT